MRGLRIAEVAERTGVPASTVRYYEDLGLVDPAPRAGNGYRVYGERDVDRLRFIVRAKQLGLRLDDLRELLRAWDGQDCAAVQAGMTALVSARLAQTHERIADLVALAAQLRVAARRLSGEPTPGGCDDGCVCASTTDTAREARSVACTLAAPLRSDRVEQWRATLDRATAREPLPGGVSLTFAHDPELTVELARLAAAEHTCCAFFSFVLNVDSTGVRFEVRAPAEAHDIVAAVFGTPGRST